MKKKAFSTVKTVANQDKIRSFSHSAPSDYLNKMFRTSTPFQFFC